MDQEQAQERIKELKEWYSHVTSYVVVNLFVVALNLWTSPEFLWSLFSIGGWGIGLVIHYFSVFGTGAAWEKRKIEELTGHRATQDELERLSERTNNLVTILSSINWDKIDPDFLDTRDNLKHAQENIVALRNGTDDSLSSDEVAKEIEKLEEFVTGPKFQFIDKAQG